MTMTEATEPDLAAENARLRALVDQLSVRVIAAEDNRADAADLKAENADLRKALAGTTSTPEAVTQLRAWVPDYCDGASYVAMPAVMAKKLLAELERLSRIITVADDGCTCMAVTAAMAADGERA